MSHTTKSVLDMIEICPDCRASYIPENGEVCKCPEPMFEEHPFQPQEVNDDEADA